MTSDTLSGMLLAYLLVLASLAELSQSHVHDNTPEDDLAKQLFCPECNMMTSTSDTAHVAGSQAVYTCFMTGHLSSMINNPSMYLRGSAIKQYHHFPQPYSSYYAQHSASCPVCHKALAQNNDPFYGITLGPKGNQKIFACSPEHASEVQINAKAYFLDPKNTSSSESFCSGEGSVMFNGFKSSYQGECVRLLVSSIVLSSRASYALGFLVILIFALGVEVCGEAREVAQVKLMRRYGTRQNVRAVSWAHYFVTLQRYLPLRGSLTVVNQMEEQLIDKSTTEKILPIWCHLTLALLFMCHIAAAYLLMLVVMTYETGLFLAVILGLGLGFLLFKDVEGENMSGNIDPCCST